MLSSALAWSKKGKLKKVNHISTAYVVGTHKGFFTENDLDLGQSFNTTYERSKFEAEKLVEQFRNKGLRIDVFRPPIVIGDSKTGKILQFRNLYHFIDIARSGIFESLPFKGMHIHAVPIDYLCKAIYRISEISRTDNGTYHPFPNTPVPLDKLLTMASRLLGFNKPKVIPVSNYHLIV
jgi:thioester reductase-like protein